MMIPIQTHSPYRYFFAFSIIGMLAGLAQFLFHYSGYGISWHREIMITLFLLPAAAGFLYTASPRFLNAKPTGKKDIILLCVLFTALIMAYALSAINFFLLLKLITLTVIAVFFVSRWLRRGANNPYWPPFILVSLATGWFAACIQAISQWVSVPVLLLQIGNRLYYEGMFWILLFGIGLKFFPMLTGAVSPVYKNKHRSLISKSVFEHAITWFIVAILGLISFILPELAMPALGLTLRAIVLLFMAYQGWALFEKPLRKGYTTQVLRIFLSTILTGHFIFIFWPDQLVHLYHIVFICGFLSLTIAVETRVLLSHEHLDVSYEQGSKMLLVGYGLLYISMLTRVLAVVTPKQYILHLHYASGIALAGVLLLFSQLAMLIWRKHPVRKN
jgi:uncharacterized protein involved in response to NO